jgi:hypothetical protein
LKITIKDGKRNENKIFGTGFPINILLYEDHYMINEDLSISPFYIKNYHEIENADTCRFWTKNNKRKIIGRNYVNVKTYYTIHNDGMTWNIKTIINAIFEIDGFKPITTGDRIASKLIMSENEKKKCLFPIMNLEYNPKYCTRLKE